MHVKRIRKTGLPPGSLIFTGEQKSDVIIKKMVRYNAEQIEEIDPESIPVPDDPHFYWLDVRGIHNPSEIEGIGKAHNLDPLLLEDILDTEQRPKSEIMENGVFVIMKHLRRRPDSAEFVTEQISMYLTEGKLITFQEHPDDTFRALKIRMQQPTSRLRIRKPDYLLYALIDFITDHYFHVIDSCSDRIHLLEDAIEKHPANALKKSIYHVRQDISEMRRILMPTRETVSSLQRMESTLITEKTRRFMRDVMDNIMQILDLNDKQSDHLSSLHDLFMSDITHHMTNAMTRLTVITSIFIPLTFITSIYGMNFRHMPELAWPWAYGALWGFMLVIGVLQLIYYKKKKWL